MAATTYTYEDYLAEWESQVDKPPKLSRTEFWDTLEEFLGYKQQIGDAYRHKENRRGDSLREKRRPLKLALLL